MAGQQAGSAVRRVKEGGGCVWAGGQKVVEAVCMARKGRWRQSMDRNGIWCCRREEGGEKQQQQEREARGRRT